MPAAAGNHDFDNKYGKLGRFALLLISEELTISVGLPETPKILTTAGMRVLCGGWRPEISYNVTFFSGNLVVATLDTSKTGWDAIFQWAHSKK